jgi:hypothetical protein
MAGKTAAAKAPQTAAEAPGPLATLLAAGEAAEDTPIRLLLAAAALTGILANQRLRPDKEDPNKIAALAFSFADATFCALFPLPAEAAKSPG